jgi:hypothetical protein
MAINRDRDALYMTTTAHTILKHNITSKLTSVIAGTYAVSGFADGSKMTMFSSPYGVATDTNGHIFVADQSNNRIRKITSVSVNHDNVTTYAGYDSGYVDGSLTESRFHNPLGLAVDSSSTIYIGDSINCVIRRIVGNNVDTLVGTGACGVVDSLDPQLVQFANPIHLAMTDGGDYLYVAEQSAAEGYPVRRVYLGKRSAVVTVANFTNPVESIAVDTSGNVFITQSNYVMSIDFTSEVVIADDLGGSVRGIAYSSFDSVHQSAAFFVQSDDVILKLTNLGNCTCVN